MSFTDAYRRGIKPDGRAVWWEHAIVFVPAFSALGMWLTHWWQSAWPYAILTLSGLVFALWSHRQDKAVQLLAEKEPRYDVPLPTRLYGVLFIALTIWIISQWLYRGHY